jgi:hypothetical protein
VVLARAMSEHRRAFRAAAVAFTEAASMTVWPSSSSSSSRARFREAVVVDEEEEEEEEEKEKVLDAKEGNADEKEEDVEDDGRQVNFMVRIRPTVVVLVLKQLYRS